MVLSAAIPGSLTGKVSDLNAAHRVERFFENTVNTAPLPTVFRPETICSRLATHEHCLYHRGRSV